MFKTKVEIKVVEDKKKNQLRVTVHVPSVLKVGYFLLTTSDIEAYLKKQGHKVESVLVRDSACNEQTGKWTFSLPPKPKKAKENKTPLPILDNEVKEGTDA